MSKPSKMYIEDRWPSSEEDTTLEEINIITNFGDNAYGIGSDDCCCSLHDLFSETALSGGNFGVS